MVKHGKTQILLEKNTIFADKLIIFGCSNPPLPPGDVAGPGGVEAESLQRPGGAHGIFWKIPSKNDGTWRFIAWIWENHGKSCM